LSSASAIQRRPFGSQHDMGISTSCGSTRWASDWRSADKNSSYSQIVFFLQAFRIQWKVNLSRNHPFNLLFPHCFFRDKQKL
jgi:hypothetical protein